MMQVRRYSDPVEFYERVESFLLAREAEHCLLLGLSKRAAAGEYDDPPPYLAAAEADGKVAAVCMRTPPLNVILSEMDDPACAMLFAQDLNEIWTTLPGLFSPPAVAKAFYERWFALTGETAELAYREMIYRLDKVIYRPAVDGEMVRATESDFDLLVNWYDAFHAESLGNMTASLDARKMVKRQLSHEQGKGGLYFWKVEGKPVAMAGYGNPTPNGIRIGPVYTPPEYRGFGYGTAISAAISQHLLDSGRQFVFLFADSDYAPSNHVYRKIGYQPVSDAYQYNFRAGGQWSE